MRSRTFFTSNDPHTNVAAEERTRRANRRRFTVFVAVFVVVALAGLVYDFSRPAIYEATARLNLVAATGQARPNEQVNFIRDEVQFLTSRTLLATVWDRLNGAPVPPPPVSIADPAASLQTMLTASPVEGTSIVSLKARGGEPTFLKAFLDRLVAAYQVSISERYKSASSDAIVQVRDEAKKLGDSVVAKRKDADEFRAKYNIVSLERDENQVLSEVKGNATALNAANDKVIAAEARLNALQDAQAAGQSVTRSKDNPTLASLEQQAASIRADLKEVARTFTPQYMAIDPRVKSMRERLIEIEQQMVQQRQASQQGALQEAKEELAGARSASAALKKQLANNQQSVQSFTSRFNEYKGMQEEVVRVEQLRQKAAERQAALEAEESARVPKVEVLEPAATPTSAASPLYARDAAIALVAALIAGLLAMAIVELFNRPPPQPAAIVMPQTWVPVPMNGMATPVIAADPAKPLLDRGSPPTAALPAPPIELPRELTTDELRDLLDASDRPLRIAIVLLSMGVTPREVLALRRGDVDPDVATVRIAGAEARTLTLPRSVAQPFADDARAADAAFFAARNGAPMTDETLDGALLYAAHDAGIDRANEVTALAVHHTYVAHLVRQGVRFSELVKVVGDLRPESLAAYGQMTPPGPRKALDQVDDVMPVIRELTLG